MACRSYICFGKEKVVHANKEKREEINMRYDEKKFIYKSQIVIICII
jgi:hypothetical protein